MKFSRSDQYIAQAVSDRRSIMMWAAVTAGSLLLVGLIVGAPMAQSTGHGGFAFTIYRAFRYVCHQLPERSFHLAGHQFAVCARCTGLYVGFAAASLIYPLVRSLKRTDAPAPRWLLVAAAPMTIEVALDLLGIWKNTHLSRLITGLVLGSIAAFYVVPGLIDLLHYDWRNFSLRRARETKGAMQPVPRTSASASGK